MSTTIISLILIVSIVLLIAVFRFINKRNHIKKKDKLVSLFQEAGEKYHLMFSSQEILHNSIIGFDGLSRKLLYIDEHGESILISLDDVKNYAVNKKIDSYIELDNKANRSENFVSTIDLDFEFKNKTPNFSIPFYNRLIHPLTDLKKLEAKATAWVTILKKMNYPSEGKVG